MFDLVKKYISVSKNTRVFTRRLNNELKVKGISNKDIRLDSRKYLYKIDDVLKNEPNLERKVVIKFVTNVSSYEQAFNYLKMIKKAKNLKLGNFFDFKRMTDLLINGKDPDFYFNIAKFYKNFNLEENQQGNFELLVGYIDIPEKDLQEITDTLIYTKNAGCPLTQKDIVKYYDSNRPYSEDLEDLKEAWIFAHEHNIKVSITEFIQSIKYNRKPHRYVVNYNKILVNDLPIPYDRFKVFDIPQEKISELIDLMVKSKHAEIYIDFEILYDDIKLKRDVWSVMRYLIKFEDSDFKTVDYNKLRDFLAYGGELDKLHEAFLYNRERSIIDEKVLFDRVLEIILVKNPNLKFDALLCVKAIELSYIHIEEEIKKTGGQGFKKSEVANEVFNDYLAGVDVYEIVNYIKYAKEHDVFISYNNAKLLNKIPNFSFKDAIYQALNPIILKDLRVTKDENGNEHTEINTLKVTTKDNIEIKINMEIEAVLLPNNYFKGSDEKILFQRASAILIDEIQRKYNHDEIILNIEKISTNVLFRLLEEIREVDIKYIPESGMTKPVVTEHGDGHNTEEHNEHKEIIHESEHHEVHKEVKHEISSQKKTNDKIKFITVSKYKPLKVIIPRIDFEKATFKEFEKAKADFEHHKHVMHIELEKLKAEIDIKKAWAKDDNIKYKFLDEEEKNTANKHH